MRLRSHARRVLEHKILPYYAGRSDYDRLTDVQYIIRRRISPITNIGCAPNIRYNWETDQLSLPVGLGFDTLVNWGPLPVKIGSEFHYYVEQDDNFGPEWMLRLFFVPVLPSPGWSKTPLFGG